MALEFNIHSESGLARTASLVLPHATVETPVFMPVGTVASVKAVPQDVLESLGARIILGNTYHLYLRPGHERVRSLGGLHRFMSWPRALLTDSGGFQVFSLGDLRKVTEDGVRFRSHLDGSSHFFTPEFSMEVQLALGADIAMAFDECTEYPAEYSRARSSLDQTMRWARRSLDYFRAHQREVPWPRAEAGPSTPLRFGRDDNSFFVPENATPSLFGIVQGSTYLDLRRESAQRLVEMDFDGYAIGGLSVGEPRERTREMLAETLPLLPKDKPRYLMGVGYPDEIMEYAAMGVDMMDCVLPTRAARHNLLFTSQGRLNIKAKRFADDQSPPDPACPCAVCRRYTRAYLRHLAASAEPLSQTLNSIHNLAFYLDTMQSVRDSIRQGTLADLLASAARLRAHVE